MALPQFLILLKFANNGSPTWYGGRIISCQSFAVAGGSIKVVPLCEAVKLLHYPLDQPLAQLQAILGALPPRRSGEK